MISELLREGLKYLNQSLSDPAHQIYITNEIRNSIIYNILFPVCCFTN